MYTMPEMINMGLNENEKWVSNAHKKVAQTLLLCNPLITTRDKLINGVAKIQSIPKKRIKTITRQELVSEFEFSI